MKKSFLSASLLLLVSGLSLQVQATNLLEAYKDAVKNDPQTLKAKAQYDVAKASESVAFSSLLPSIGFTASYTATDYETYVGAVTSTDSTNPTPSTFDNDVTTLSYGLSLSQSIFKMGDWYSLDAAEKRALQAQAGFDLAQQTLITRVSVAYFNVLKAQDNLEFIQAEKKAIERQLEQTKQRFNVGLTAITDVHEAQANFDSAVAEEIRGKNSIEIAKETLREITGKYYSTFDGLNTDRFEATMPAPLKIQHWVTKSEESNLELKAKELLVEATKYDIQRAQSGHYPTLDLTASLTNSDESGLYNAVDYNEPALNTTSIGLNLTVPIYSGGATSAAVKQAQANYVYASQDMEATHRSVVRQARTSFADVVALVSTLKALEQSVISAESALKATQAGFEVGTRTIVDVLNSTQNLFNAKRNLSNTRYDYILAMLTLKQSSGSLTGSDVEAVNSGLSAS